MLKIVELTLLYDFYGQLLTERQQKIFGLYYNDDLSLGEISENLNITRQAVYDILKRVEKLLLNYEERLKLVDKYLAEREKINKLKTEIAQLKNYIEVDNEIINILEYIENILDDLSNH